MTVQIVVMWKLIAILFALLCGSASAWGRDACGPGRMREAKVRGGVLELLWERELGERMSADIAAGFDRYKSNISGVSLSLHSCGGSLPYVQRVVAVLEQIKASRELITLVDRGAMCGSGCVPIFLAGQRRVAALSSLFYFHAVRVQIGDPGTVDAAARNRIRAKLTDEVLSRYFESAGLSPDWLEYLRRTLRTHDFWQSGRDLWESNSGVITETIDNLVPRGDGPIDLPTGTICGVQCRG